MRHAERLTAKVNGCEETGSNPARSMLKKREKRLGLLSPIRPKSASGSRVPQIAPPHGQAYFGTRRAMHKGQDGATGFRAASGRLKRKSAVRQNGAIKTGADNGARTRDPHLGKVVLYQLSHVRKYGGENRIRTGGEGFAGPCLTTWPSRHYQKKPARKRASNELERTTGLEPATPTLARWCSTN